MKPMVPRERTHRVVLGHMSVCFWADPFGSQQGGEVGGVLPKPKKFFCKVREMACKTRIKRVCNKLSVRGERAGRVALGQKLVGPRLDFLGWG